MSFLEIFILIFFGLIGLLVIWGIWNGTNTQASHEQRGKGQ